MNAIFLHVEEAARIAHREGTVGRAVDRSLSGRRDFRRCLCFAGYEVHLEIGFVNKLNAEFLFLTQPSVDVDNNHLTSATGGPSNK